MTNEELNEIEKLYQSAKELEAKDRYCNAYDSVVDDIPKLIAEIRRLNEANLQLRCISEIFQGQKGADWDNICLLMDRLGVPKTDGRHDGGEPELNLFGRVSDCIDHLSSSLFSFADCSEPKSSQTSTEP